VLDHRNDRSKLDLINDGKQALQLVHPDCPKLNSWGNHARDELVEETKSEVMDQVDPGSGIQSSSRDLLPERLHRKGFHTLVLRPL
jgi:hypothetical protein